MTQSFEIANAYAKTVQLTAASLDPETEEYGLTWEQAFAAAGVDPALEPVVISLLDSSRADVRAWVEKQVGVKLPS